MMLTLGSAILNREIPMMCGYSGIGLRRNRLCDAVVEEFHLFLIFIRVALHGRVDFVNDNAEGK